MGGPGLRHFPPVLEYLPACDSHWRPFDICAWLSAQPTATAVCTCTVTAAANPQARPLRLVAGRLPPEKAAAAATRARAAARKEHRQIQPQTLLLAEFYVVVTNLPASCTPAMILAWYRLRWQIEWCFRRWKSLCQLAVLPAYPTPLAEVVLYAKLILVVLLQLYLGDLPWTEWWTGADPAPVVSTLVSAAYTHFCSVLCPPAALPQLFEDPTRFLRHLRSSRRKRLLQVAAIADAIQNMLQTPLVATSPPLS